MIRRVALLLVALCSLAVAPAVAQETQETQQTARAALEAAIEAVQSRTDAIRLRDAGFDGFTQRGLRAAAWTDELTAELTSLREQRQRIDERVSSSGMTAAIRFSLRRYRTGLPDIQEDERQISQRDIELSGVDTRLIEIEKERETLDDLDLAVTNRLDACRPRVEPGEFPDLEQELRDALTVQANTLDLLLEAGSVCFEHLINLNKLQRMIVAEAESFRAYIDGSTMWIRDALPITPEGLRAGQDTNEPGLLESFGQAVLWMFGPRELAETSLLLWGDVRANALPAALLLLSILLLARLRPRLRRPLLAIGERVGRNSTDAYYLTMQALGLTALLAVLWPSVLLLFAWRLTLPDTNTDFSSAVAAGLRSTAYLAMGLNMLRQTCRPGGLGETHFRWSSAVAGAVRKHLRLLSFAVLPATFVISMLNAHGNSDWSESLGRACFLVAYLSMIVVSWHMLRSTGRIVQTLIARNRERWVMWLNLIWRPLLVVPPVAFVILACAGFYGTVLTLQLRFQMTIWLGAVLLVVHALLLRWLYVVRRHMALEKARERRAAAAALAAAEGDSAPAPLDADTVDIGSLNSQTRRILGSLQVVLLLIGTWMIWVDVLPALGILNSIELWSHTGQVQQPKTLSGGQPDMGLGTQPPRMETVEAEIPVTLADAFLAVVAVVMTVIATRNVPGLLEMTLLRRLPFEPAGRYAILTLTRYLLSIVGVIMAFGAIGIGWGEVQWLAAAITVGLGFGLQEIFANFVSGIILLIERPIRVGDTVTVADVHGTVSRIRMRATTIVDWDRKELVVPNKDFITTKLVNWTLADTTLRTIIRVGIAYGSDTRKVTELLYKIAADNPEVLPDPPPRVVFLTFGESSLDFELRVFVNSPEQVRHIPHELNTAIDDAFREAGIEIAFPQRDLHIRGGDGVIRFAPPETKD